MWWRGWGDTKHWHACVLGALAVAPGCHPTQPGTAKTADPQPDNHPARVDAREPAEGVPAPAVPKVAPAERAVPQPLSLLGVEAYALERDECGLSVNPKPLLRRATSWDGLFDRMNAEEFVLDPPKETLLKQRRLCEAVDQAQDGRCAMPLSPLLLAMGDVQMPGAFRVGFVMQTAERLLWIGPVEAGIQVFQCQPQIETKIGGRAAGDGLSQVSVEVVEQDRQRVAECDEPNPEDCPTGCVGTRMVRHDLFVDSAFAVVHVGHTRALSPEADEDTLRSLLEPQRQGRSVVLNTCDGEQLKLRL